jgi:hypothetical protein
MPSRPKTPVDRSGAESSLGNTRKPPVPSFLLVALTRNLTMLASNPHATSVVPTPLTLMNKPLSVPFLVSRTPTGQRPQLVGIAKTAPEHLAREAAAKRTITKPTRRRNFGDGASLKSLTTYQRL